MRRDFDVGALHLPANEGHHEHGVNDPPTIAVLDHHRPPGTDQNARLGAFSTTAGLAPTVNQAGRAPVITEAMCRWQRDKAVSVHRAEEGPPQRPAVPDGSPFGPRQSFQDRNMMVPRIFTVSLN